MAAIAGTNRPRTFSVSCGSYLGTEQERSFAARSSMRRDEHKKRRRPNGRLRRRCKSYPLLAEMPQSVRANEGGAGLTGETAAIAVRPVIAVIGVTVIAERRRGDCTGRSDRAADDTGRNVSRPEAAIGMNLHTLLIHLRTLLRMPNGFRSRMRAHRQCRRRNRGRQNY